MTSHWVLMGVKHLRNCGMSIEVIKAYVELCLMGDSTVLGRLEVILEQKANIDTQLEELSKCSQFLNER
jgi:DNA-binding transcriptional MerR regulator